ncbi:MAG: tRNA lysidine(34) synthetase TilS, partial [Oscillospiraceae bacterium]|nr:tRNA lysidine(34) synthetase TilS [Oscillospiraceae bacterium]
MNFMRGSGLKGLCGIPYKRGKIIRPLLDVSRKEIEEYCEKNDISYVTDATNLETVYTRNKIRHILIPEITKQFNPSFTDTITKNAAVIAVDEDFIESEVLAVYNRIVKDNSVDTGELCLIHKAVALRVIRKITAELCGNEDIPSSVIEAVLELAKKNRTGTRCDIARGVYARIEYGKLIIAENQPPCGDFCYEIVIGEKTYIPELGYYVLAEFCDDHKKGKSEYFSVPEGSKIAIRNRRSGDKFAPWGMVGTKKLKDFMIDSKIPKGQRSRIGILTIDNEIAWVIGYRRSRKFRFNRTGIKISILY